MTAPAQRAHHIGGDGAVVARPAQPARAPAAGEDGAFASIEIHHEIGSVASAWSGLLKDSLATPYQSPAFIGAWAEHAGRQEGCRPLIVLARDAAGEPVALLPFGVKRRFGLTVCRFLGGSHVNYNMAVIRRDRLAAFANGGAARLLATAAKAAGVDAYALVNQPAAWLGAPNPFASLPLQPAADSAYCGPLAPNFEEHVRLFVSAKTRSKQRRKMRRFEERGTPRIYRAETPAERRLLLDVYFEQKAIQFATRGLDNVFAVPGVRDFLDEACGLDGSTPSVDLYGFEMDDEVVAVTGGIADGVRYSAMFISITNSEHAKYSPGEMLINFVVEDAIRRGMSSFDLGVGAATYKKMYCPTAEPLFDSIFGVTWKGRMVAAAAANVAAAKARIKATPWAYRLIDRARRARARLKGAAPDAPEPQADPAD